MTMDVVQKVISISTKSKIKHSLRSISSESAMEQLESSRTAGDKRKVTDLRKLKLKKKLLEVAEHNETLNKTINEKNNEITDLRRSIQSLNEVLNSVPIDELRCNSSIASSKILELSKKNRILRAELETTKNRISKKDMQIQKLERDLKLTEEKSHQDGESVRKINFAPIEELQAKLSNLQQKLFETRNKNAELQSQLKLAQKCLQQEVGESFNLNILASQPQQSNWRGRSQQIIHLQQKIHELKERLDMYERQPSGRMNSFTCVNASGGQKDVLSVATLDTCVRSPRNKGKMKCANPSIASTGTSLSFDRFAPSVRKSEILHRAKVDELEKQIADLKVQLEEHRSKILALKVRNKTLNDEVLKYKSKASTLEEKSDFNGINIATINEKISVQKYQYETRLEEMSRHLKDVMKQREEAELREEDMRRKVNNLESILANKEEYIAELDDVIKKLETDLKALCGGFLFSCRELRKEEFIAILDCLEAEKTHLIEHNKNLNERLTREHCRTDTLSEQLSKSKILIKRLETKIRDLERELDAQAERKKRTQRIAEYANSVSATSLTSSVGSFVFENSSLMNANALYNEELTQDQILDLKNQLEFATEKITLLEEKIAHLTEEKEIDTKTFEDIISNSKNIIMETILSHKNGFNSNVAEKLPTNNNAPVNIDEMHIEIEDTDAAQP